MKNTQLSLIFTVTIMVLALLMVTGCDEGMHMMDPIINDPITNPGGKDTGNTGEMKQPGEDADPGEQNPGEGTDPEEQNPGEQNPGEQEPEDPETLPPPPHENDFVGQVSQTLLSFDDQGGRTYYTGPVAGVTLTVVSGERAGEWSVTDENGNYRFSDPAKETLQLHLRAEKEGYEPKEVIVHRSQPTETLAGGVHFSHRWEKPQDTPGTILIGHRWPDKVRFILEETALPHDLLLLIVDDVPNYAGLYSKTGVVVAENANCLLKTIAHELGHAHQHAVAVTEGGATTSIGYWEATPSGKAYLKAQAKDWEEVGKMRFYDKGRYLTPIENMAYIAKDFWNMRGNLDTSLCSSSINLKEEAPNRYRWAQEWLSKTYE